MTSTKSARRLTERITKSVMATLATRVRVVKGPLVKSKGHQRQLDSFGSLLDVATFQAVIESDKDDARQSLKKAVARREVAETLSDEGTRHLAQQRSDLAKVEQASAEQVEQLAVLRARWDKSMEQVNATAARNAVYAQRQRDETGAGFLSQAMATNDPDLRAGYLEMLTGGES
jgi:flagellar motility protein MotE (MotC chaperone)